MVHLQIFNPARKLRMVSAFIFRGSRRLLGSLDAKSVMPPKPLPRAPGAFSIALGTRTPTDTSLLEMDTDYFGRDKDSGFCVFQVENTLFKIHKVLLSREPCAFSDMFGLPQPDHEICGTEAAPVHLTDTVPRFKDFLWAIYAAPTELFKLVDLPRLINIAELSNKYCFSSLEGFVVERIHQTSQVPDGPLFSSSSALQGRILDLAILCGHQKLQELITQHLICRVLWYNTRPEAVISIARKHNIKTLLGVCYYRQLVRMEDGSRRESCVSGIPAESIMHILHFPQNISPEKRERFLRAHQSLLSLWEQIQAMPPQFQCTESCGTHNQCISVWRETWYDALDVDRVMRSGSADILSRLKAVMFALRKSLSDAPFMGLQCKMAALESLSKVRDDIIEGLVGHFDDPC